MTVVYRDFLDLFQMLLLFFAFDHLWPHPLKLQKKCNFSEAAGQVFFFFLHTVPYQLSLPLTACDGYGLIVHSALGEKCLVWHF